MGKQYTRKQILQRAGAGAMGVSLAALLAACGGGGIDAGGGDTAADTGGGEPTTAEPTTGEAGGGTTAGGQLADKIVWSNWQLYLDVNEDETAYPTLEAFTAATGVEVEYLEGDINGNEEFFAKIQQQLVAGQDVGRDLVVLTDTSGVPGRMIDLGYVEKLDKSAIPNAVNLQDALAHPSYDPEREYTLPWQGGMTGIGYDPTKTDGEIPSLEQVFTDPKLKGKVTFLTEMPDTVGLAMLLNGDDPTAVTDDAFARAIETVQAAVDSGQVRQFTGNEYSAMLAGGDVWVSLAWSGDIVQLQPDNPNLQWVQPDEGSMIWTDQLMIPKGGDVFTASTLINWYYDPEIAAQAAAWINYISPVKGASEVLLEQDPDIANNVLIFPTDEMLAKAHLFDVGAADNDTYKEQFQVLLGA